jgi:predicted nucleic acid-binding protein
MKQQMTELIFFDNDCISSFLWVSRESLLALLYPGRMVLPQQVYEELRVVPSLFAGINTFINNKRISVEQMQNGTPEADLYTKLLYSPEAGYLPIDKGEAAAIALAKTRSGVLASNNLKDISQYISLYNLKFITTAEILLESLDGHLISEGQGNVIWKDMLNRRRTLPTATFSEYLASRVKK